jgi:phage gp36-like protein
MKKFFVLLLISALLVPVFATTGRVEISRPSGGIAGAGFEREAIMGYCTLADLEGAYSADQIAAWSRLDPDKVDKAIKNAAAEIDGYLISGGYTVPLAGPPENLKKYCVDLACARLVLGAGILENDPGGKAVLEEAKNARHYLEKVADGKFRIPGYSGGEDEVSKPPSGNVQVSASRRLDLRGY